ncbi:MAG: glycosyltransferase family 4 protein [Opitutaceae bacterium]|nr:glycosyltransferase family 4 protein [Opitutaceae bacterium]
MPAANPLTVLQYTGYVDDRGGIVTSIRHLAAAGDFRSILGVSRRFRAGSELSLEVMGLPPIEAEKITPATMWRARAVALPVRDWLRGGPGRVFHGHSRAGLCVALWLHALGESRAVVSVHCYGRQRWFYRAAKRILDGRLRWLTPAMRRHYYGGGQVDWTDCVPNGVPGRPVPTMHRWPGQPPLRIGGAGQLTANKRWHLVLEALARLPPDIPVEFYHAGGPTGDAASAAYAEALTLSTWRLGLEKRVHWLGWQPSSAPLLTKVDAVVVPFQHESFSLVALEALYAGIPVMAARGGGPDDLVLQGVNGWLFPADDPEALASLWRQLLQPAPWNELRMDPQHLGRFSAAHVAGQWAEIYATL